MVAASLSHVIGYRLWTSPLHILPSGTITASICLWCILLPPGEHALNKQESHALVKHMSKPGIVVLEVLEAGLGQGYNLGVLESYCEAAVTGSARFGCTAIARPLH